LIQRIPQPATREKAMEMLARGELDGSLDPYAQESATVRRVLPDWRAEAAAYFQRRGIYPMSHTLIVQRELLDEHPWVGESLYEAFKEARQQAPRYQDDQDRATEHWLWEVLDQDPRTYRLGPVERRTLEELVRYQLQQGLRSEPIDPIAQFAFYGD
jgi:4,5-dihydroxyphthalate decarboxylase